MRMKPGAWLVPVLAAVIALPGNALASVTIGSPLTNSPNSNSSGTLQVQTALPGATLGSPIEGTIVRWRIRGTVVPPGGIPNTFQLRVLTPNGDGTFTAAGTSAMVSTPNAASDDTVRVFSTGLPIRAGAQLGISAGFYTAGGFSYTSQVPSHIGATGARVDYFLSAADGLTTGPSLNNTPTLENLFNADVVGLPNSKAVGQYGCIEAIQVVADPDPATGPKALHYRIDGGAERTSPTIGAGYAAVLIPSGNHTLEYWGEDKLGQIENAHHTVPLSASCASLIPPKLTAAHLSRTTFKAASHGASIAAATTGTTITYHESEAATVKFTVLKPAAGHKRKGKCVTGAAHKHQKSCQLQMTAGTFTHTGPTGDVSIHFTGRVGGRKLKPGQYVLVLTPTSGTHTGASKKRNFQIVR